MHKANEIFKSALQRHDMGMQSDAMNEQMKIWIQNDIMLESIKNKEVCNVL